MYEYFGGGEGWGVGAEDFWIFGFGCGLSWAIGPTSAVGSYGIGVGGKLARTQYAERFVEWFYMGYQSMRLGYGRMFSVNYGGVFT